MNEAQQKSVEYHDSNTSFKFGSGERFRSLYKAVFPAKIGSNEIYISSDIVETIIPLLLSKDSMKTAETEINFQNDIVKMFGEEQDVHLTQSGHYALPLNNSRKVMKDIRDYKDSKIVLITKNEDDKNMQGIQKTKCQTNVTMLGA